ncbi:zinc-dependent alcohol dehydrogenase family protein [Fructilactobacillus fructivorans]|uniref:zinc-dependent alcohol dehydrogenase family protein n=1 Tax=Fructilactobacillus fructivorans TaxID=1614 RepID=UPI0007055BE9|nr:zinc-dependent alcohol dehydrogenase family protein [Fructilactobacillus fructivorans]KRN39715.1 zinc-binding alcohol dehydrogenase family protein [Fructilactobacillus fructivorans]KRN42298.1 zinc-binding alcohol dehydrogenase family protein [Fructilactobacillus fructivorans]
MVEETKINIPKIMNAWEIVKPGPINGDKSPLKYVRKEVPTPGDGEVLVKVLTCGVCHTDLHVTEGDLPVHKKNLTPGHEIIGKVVKNGPHTRRFKIGERIGIPWLRKTCGVCKYCRSGRENLCPYSKYTGWDHDGGYEEYTTVPEGFAYRIPERFNSLRAAPLLCAGIIGYRAFERANIPAGGTLGIYGFGGSAHITAQLAIDQGIEVHVFTRGEDAKKFALSLGAKSVNNTYDMSPVPLDSSIIFAPVGEAVPNALESLAPGGTLALAGIHMSDIPQMSYEDHIFHEKNLTSVESNTRSDGEEFLTLADRLHIEPDVTEFPLAKADEALKRVAKGDLKGACVLNVGLDSE